MSFRSPWVRASRDCRVIFPRRSFPHRLGRGGVNNIQNRSGGGGMESGGGGRTQTPSAFINSASFAVEKSGDLESWIIGRS